MNRKEDRISRSSFLRRTLYGSSALMAVSSPLLTGFTRENKATSSAIKLATFAIDATPPLGDVPIGYPDYFPDRVDDPLSCRGVIILSEDQPIVLVSVDWIGIGNGGYDLWRMRLAQAAGTSPDRVQVHVLHQHDAPRFNISVENLLLAQDLNVGVYGSSFTYGTIERAAEAIKQAMKEAVQVTHVGDGMAEVKKFASTRRILGEDGNVKHVRFTSTGGNPELREYPEGLIDPKVRLISFWNRDSPVAVLSYYATHPQSYYLEGGISCDTVGIARNSREQETGIFHLHFNGAGGNVGAGKYNDGSHKNRQILADRLASGMKKAFDATTKVPIREGQIEWRVHPVLLPPEIRRDEKTFTEAELSESYNREAERMASDRNKKGYEKRTAERLARDLDWMRRCNMGQHIDLSCLRLGEEIAIVHMPGELNIEYQLAAQKMREDLFVVMAAYGDCGPGYICARASYPKGGYEAGRVSRVAPDVEDVLTEGMQQLLHVKNVRVMPSDFTRQKKKFKN